MFKKRMWIGIILSIIFLVFSLSGFTAYYKYTQESGTNFYVGTDDKADALEDTNEIRQIIDDLGALLVHSKRDDAYPKNGLFGGTIQIPEAGLKFSNAPENNDIAAYITGEMAWQTKAELGLDLTLYYLKTEINTQAKVETIWGVSLVNDGDLDLYYLKTDINTQAKVETIWGVSLANDSELHTQNTDTQLDLYSALFSDHTWTGEKDLQPVGEAVVFGDLLYPDWTAGEWLKADADLAAKMPGLRIALEDKTDGQACLMLVKGYIRDDSAFEFTASMVYTSVTPGAMSSTAPSVAGQQLQRVGVAKSADVLFFDPSIDVGEIKP